MKILKVFLILVISRGSLAEKTTDREKADTELVPEQEDPLLMFSTLAGSLVGVGQRSGIVRWRQDDEPVVKVPVDLSRASTPVFLPDPKDGSLYLFGTERETLKKLPFTIPQLVASSPCRSSDGILYTGRKIDTWFTVDPRTGEREQLMGFDKAKNTCPLEMQDALFVGRTEYNIIMVDSKKKDRKWNVTFYDYSAAKMEPDGIENYGRSSLNWIWSVLLDVFSFYFSLPGSSSLVLYVTELVHFTTSSTGRVVTLDRRLGVVLWELDIESPVTAVYIMGNDGLLAVPFTSVAEGTLDLLLDRFATKPSDIQLFPTLYIGQHRHGLYALPSLVDSTTATISSSAGHLLLEGPLSVPQLRKNDNRVPQPGDHVYLADIDTADQNYQSVKRDKSVVVIGHYEVPAEYKSPTDQPLQITGRSDPVVHSQFSHYSNSTDDLPRSSNDSTSQAYKKLLAGAYVASKTWLNQQENKALKLALIILFGCIIAMFWYLNAQFKEFQQFSQGSRENSRTSDLGRSGMLAMPEDVGEGLVKVGKITFDTGQVLGKGCEGTFVYRGEFDGRSVAVKRLLPDCFTFADREVALLRESDAHANVVRYFCTEQDRMFRYIALELAEATLQDYVAGRYDRDKISVKNILRQATSGLAHLHYLDIVHRDIKPHNVLLSVPGPRGEVRAMISDFGLCKKLQLGRVSFSRRSGVTGTDGWIAPEMLNGDRTTCAVDIFSLGCVFYYVLSDGKHPFGDPLRRQANILCGESDLNSLHRISKNDRELALVLIKAMIDENPCDRPPAMAIYDHPLFWESPRVLSFFQDVSDRVEKEQPENPILIALESNSLHVVQRDWRSLIDLEVATDLRKYRSYRGESVRDLLRALRNKKHHYRELSPEAQASLGELPTKFTEYWLSRFPCLLIHVWSAMQPFRNEPSLKDYYHTDYNFPYSVPETNFTNQYPVENGVPVPSITSKTTDTVNTVNYSPNRTRYRPRRQERKKIEKPLTWSLPPT